MQGNLREIDIRSILQLIELGQRTGLLFVEKPPTFVTGRFESKQKSWFVFFLNGQIIYATDGEGGLSRLGDYLCRHQVKVRLSQVQFASLVSGNAAEYAFLWALIQQNIIKPQVARSIIHSLVHETLFDLLSLHQGSFSFQLSSILSPQLTSLEVTPLVSKVMRQVIEWKSLYPYIQSADQLPIVVDIDNLRTSLPQPTLNKLQRWANGKTSLRQLARFLHRDILTVAKAIYPYIQQGQVKFVSPATSPEVIEQQQYTISANDSHKGRIVCVDDATSICETVESFLQPQGYEVISLTNSLEALALIFQVKPDLIFCDISMPELDGYEICAMLRHSKIFQSLPIIMLTAKDGFIDRVRANMAGASDYLTKPFKDTELLLLVEKYLNNRVVLVKN
ncbi:MAG: response regulator [Scytonematopsis contorta HA4267-MV1]|jgi:twitching motility two-component system response regulator PilG|nr:response regulator [Scytonematopsis contorta HA4267-MV1]